jgi:hypothetical protein
VLVGVDRVAASVGEVIDLVVGEVAVLVLADAREVDPGGDVAGKSTVLDGHVEDQAEHPVDLGHAGW